MLTSTTTKKNQLSVKEQHRVSKKLRRKKNTKKELILFTKESLRCFVNEGEILSILHHPCIIDILGFSNGDESHPPSIFLSLEPTSLEKAFANNELEESDKNRITVELVLGMRYIRKRNFMHRDLKPSKILLSKNLEVRVSDFGLAKEEDISFSQTKGIGTLRFMAPELFEENEGRMKCTSRRLFIRYHAHLHRDRQIPAIQHEEHKQRHSSEVTRHSCWLGFRYDFTLPVIRTRRLPVIQRNLRRDKVA